MFIEHSYACAHGILLKASTLNHLKKGGRYVFN